jgi:hypothetical protein
MTAGTRSVPSDAVILERALSLANEAMFTLDLQWRRVHTDEPEDARFPMRVWSDLSFFIVTLQRVRRLATFACSVAATAVELRQALADFDRSVPMLKVMRDVSEHIDDYALENGRRHHRQVTRAFLQVAQWDGTAYTWLGETLNLNGAQLAARNLYDAIRRAASG